MLRGGLLPLLPRDSPCLISAGYRGVHFCILLQLPVRRYTDVRNINSITLSLCIKFTAKKMLLHSHLKIREIYGRLQSHIYLYGARGGAVE